MDMWTYDNNILHAFDTIVKLSDFLSKEINHNLQMVDGDGFQLAAANGKSGKPSFGFRHMLNLRHCIGEMARQENPYAVFRTADNEYWNNFARESQQEFKQSGTEGKCIEARELLDEPEVKTAAQACAGYGYVRVPTYAEPDG